MTLVQQEGPGGLGMGGRSDFRRGFSSSLRGRGRGRSACGGKAEDKEWIPFIKLGRLVKDMKIKSVEEIYLLSLPIKESEIIDFFLGLEIKCSKEVTTAIRGAIILAKLSIVPVWRGYWGNKIGKPHNVPCKVTGRCGSVLVRLIPAPRGTSIVSAPVPKKLLRMAGIDDCCTSARGCTATVGNFAKATFDATYKTYSYLTPDLWKELCSPNLPIRYSLSSTLLGAADPILAWLSGFQCGPNAETVDCNIKDFQSGTKPGQPGAEPGRPGLQHQGLQCGTWH
ncbi:40S ribosomal protein S2 [Sciurus carolinensis]|uniref:Small ribosomal subunit protein uS5 n=1 Tax=Sciurus carolinensis TaxID=30640 RepID=A0AA41ND88_SCICA|nr:40S ribosomal protein S2 [Sciurus carolinensis]